VQQLAELFPEGIDSNKNERVAIVTSEILEPQWRHSIESTLCRRVYDFYSSTEMQHLITECDRGSLHINPLVGIVEIVDEQNRPAEAGQVGRVLITGLRQRSMPLVRYEIGDMAESTGFDARCSCGLQWPTIGAVQGRSEDMVVTKDGRQVGYLCFHATKNLLGIKEAQLIQRSFSEFDFLIVPGDSEPDSRALNECAIRAEITKRLQDTIDLRFHYLDAIPRGPNGKFKAVVVAFDRNGS
jgi:phenylacetate-CoA ligase